MKSKKKYFNSLFAFLPVSFLVTSSCAENFIHSKMNPVSTEPSCSGSFTDISPEDRSIKNKSKQPYKEITEWFENKELTTQQCTKYIMLIIGANIPLESKVRLVSALCAAYPDWLHDLKDENDKIVKILSIISWPY